jgi:hypothetical protein
VGNLAYNKKLVNSQSRIKERSQQESRFDKNKNITQEGDDDF